MASLVRPFLRRSWWGAITIAALALGLLLESLGVYQPAGGHEGHGGVDTFLWRALIGLPLLAATLLRHRIVQATLFIASGLALLILGGLTQAISSDKKSL